MTIFALVNGSLFKKPEQRTSSKTGAPYVTTTVKGVAGNEVQFVNVLAFSESVQAELLRLNEGDGVSLQGPFKAELYDGRDGQKRISLSITADHVQTLRQLPRERRDAKPRTQRPDLRSTLKSSPSAPPDFGDDVVPF